MLVITRRISERFILVADSDPNSQMTVVGQFLQTPIHIEVLDARGNQVRIGIDAPPVVRVLRAELNPHAHTLVRR